ncbi:MAG: ABC transporter substrate-binding protein [Candidatus Spyradocola sp.]|jgi:peptide/nickel transport system substrate-binding protein
MCLCVLLTMTTSACQSEETFNWSQLSTAPATATPEPTAESVELTVSMPSASGEFNPFTNPSAAMQGLMKLCYESLLRLDDRYQPENWLANSVTRTETGYSITLREGVLFHDGKGLTAQDVVASYEAILAAEESPWKEVVAPITGMRAEGERLLSVDTEQGYAALYALTFPIVSSQEGNAYPAGTGPYAVSSYTEGKEMNLTRWDSWWRTPAQIPSIHAMARESDESVLNTFQAGLLDVCAVDMLTVSSVTERSGVSRQDFLTGQAELLIPNLSGKMGDLRLRQAVAYALEKRDIIANTYQNHGVAVDVPVLPDSWLAERIAGVEYDADRSRELLSQLGWTDLDGDGYVDRYASATPAPTETPEASEEEEPEATVDPETAVQNSEVLQTLLGREETGETGMPTENLVLTILTNEEDTSSHRDAANRLVTQLGVVGIRAEVESVAFSDLSKEWQTGAYDLLLVGYQLPDDGNLSSLLRSDGANNWSGYQSAAMDAALDSLNTAVTEEAYYNAMQEVYNRIIEDLPVYTLCMRTSTQIAADGLTIPNVIHAGEPYRGIENWTHVKVE